MAQESFRYWQGRSIDQKQAASAVLLGTSGAAIAYLINHAATATGYVGLIQSLLLHVAASTQLLSIGAGLGFALNRVRDFDLTADIARLREKDKQAPLLGSMRRRVRRWGRLTKRLFRLQVVAFGIGALALVVLVGVRYAPVLYPQAWSEECISRCATVGPQSGR